MPQDNGAFYGMPFVCLSYHYSYYLDWFFARYTFQAPQGRSQAEPGEKHEPSLQPAFAPRAQGRVVRWVRALMVARCVAMLIVKLCMVARMNSRSLRCCIIM
jgi:hypothetical protein